jgi:hypothetical protein
MTARPSPIYSRAASDAKHGEDLHGGHRAMRNPQSSIGGLRGGGNHPTENP